LDLIFAYLAQLLRVLHVLHVVNWGCAGCAGVAPSLSSVEVLCVSEKIKPHTLLKKFYGGWHGLHSLHSDAVTVPSKSLHHLCCNGFGVWSIVNARTIELNQ
jgi:hypothetical protein